MMRHFLSKALLTLAALSGSVSAQPESVPPTLADAWLGWQAERQAAQQPPFNWAYSFALREATAAAWPTRLSRLEHEIASLRRVMRAAGEPALAGTLGAWARRLAPLEALPARSAEAPLDLLALAGDLRRNPAMDDIRLLGTCQPPDWVEAWTQSGVTRLAWQAGLTLDEVRQRLPTAATRGIDHFMVISPNGTTQEIGVAAWNHQPLPLAPGTRLVTPLPSTATDATTETNLITRELVAFLASRLPGDDCTLWQNSP